MKNKGKNVHIYAVKEEKGQKRGKDGEKEREVTGDRGH